MLEFARESQFETVPHSHPRNVQSTGFREENKCQQYTRSDLLTTNRAGFVLFLLTMSIGNVLFYFYFIKNPKYLFMRF